MSKLFTIGVLLLLFSLSGNAQIVSKFSWDVIGQDPKIANEGPNAESISSSAIISSDGFNGTNGLNAGSPKQDIVMIIKDSSIFNLDGIDLSVAYQRDETTGTFFKRGNYFSFLNAAYLTVSFRLKDSTNNNGYISVSSGNIYSIPSDNVFRVYRFKYNHFTGIGNLMVDGAVEWTYNGTPGQVMDWSNGGDIVIGTQMDGSGGNRSFYDEMVLSQVQDPFLPIELIAFDAQAHNEKKIVELNWITGSELNNDFFTIERSRNGENWESIQSIKGAGNSSSQLQYSSIDSSPLKGISYYRLKQTDFDGKYSYSSIKAIAFSTDGYFEISPNPITEGHPIIIRNIKLDNILNEIKIYDSKGQIKKNLKLMNDDTNTIIQNNLEPGLYFLVYNNHTQKLIVK